MPAAKKADIRAKIALLQVISFSSTLRSFFSASTLQRTFGLCLVTEVLKWIYSFFFKLQNEVRKAQKKIAEQNLKISVKVATEAAESAASDGKTFCIIQLDVGLDAAAVREAVSKVMEKKVNLHLLLLTTLRKGKES